MQTEDESAAAQGGEPPGGDYNLLPYPSMPFAYTQPAHLAALTALFGLEAPAADSARVLELGCASGGNIIPLAARFPNASFLGIDLSQRQIDDGSRRIAALGISNVEVRQGDLAKIKSFGEQFDYVICHGVFSWVPKAVQHAIFQICSENLAANGVAAISYNVLPGWHLRRIVRDICLHHVGNEGPPRQRVNKARWALEQIAKSANATEPYGLLMRNEAERIAKLPSSYILGEFLAAENAPCYFHEFVDWAGQYGLSYLSEGDLASSIPEFLLPETERRIKLLAGSNRLAMEQYIDFFTGRPFRRSVLTKSQLLATENRIPSPELLRPFHFASQIRLDPERSNAQVSVYKDNRGREIMTGDPAVRYALAQLAEHYPATLTLKQLIAPTGHSNVTSKAEAPLCKALFRLIAASQATVSSQPLEVGRAAAGCPRAWALARIEAAAGQPWVTSLHHTAIPLHIVLAYLLVHLDGNHDRQMLTAKLVEALRRGEIRVPELQSDHTNAKGSRLELVAKQYVERTFSYCTLHALLEPMPA
ncbi:MAG TPA: class I SAM-dependent methyltransferase [Xanthobacteraceae bacterium]|jgi:methyltransferase-like protein/trans-aconitate methyltransferase|nr:class I SAM-dependent methyltransferase [Xanthobacteraceae bacterium]